MDNGNKKTVPTRTWNSLIRCVLDAQLWKECSSHQTKDQFEANDRLLSAYAVLREAMENAPWGASGCAFITRSNRDGTCGLSINGRLRAFVEYGGRVIVYTAEEAEESYQYFCAWRKAEADRYATDREQTARLLADIGVTDVAWDTDLWHPTIGEIYYRCGQMGGTISWVIDDPESPRYRHSVVVGAGVLRRAKEIVDEESECDPFHGSPEEFSIERHYYGARY